MHLLVLKLLAIVFYHSSVIVRILKGSCQVLGINGNFQVSMTFVKSHVPRRLVGLLRKGISYSRIIKLEVISAFCFPNIAIYA